MDLAIAEPPSTAITTDLVERIAAFTEASKAPNTRRAYRAGWVAFVTWCRTRDLPCLPAPPAVVAAYIADRAGTIKTSTLAGHLSSIRHAHALAGHPTPTKSAEVSVVMAGIRRTHGIAPLKKKAFQTGDLKAVLARLPDDIRGQRDRALLLVGFCGAFRRSELVGLDVEDLEFTSEGILLSLRRGKTDQHGAGRQIAIGHGTDPKTCPVTAVRRWLTASGITRGPLFRGVDRHGHVRARRLSDRTVARVVKSAGELVGINPQVLGGHSLRSGFATSAAAADIEERVIARTTGHKSLTVLRGYIQSGTAFDGDVVKRLGL